MGLQLHVAPATRPLVERLAVTVAAGPLDPFTPIVVAVPTKGVERWVTQRLAHVLGAHDGDGVAANISFPQPARLIADAVACATGVRPDDDPWQTGRVTWTLLDVVDAGAGEAWSEPLTASLARPDSSPGRRFTVAEKLARLFATYALNRPQLIRDWTAGDDTDGAGQAVAEDLTWQPELWRRLRDRIGTPSAAERLPDALAALRTDPALVDLPEQVNVFGPTRLATAELEVLAALATGRDVHLFLPHPSPALRQRVHEHAHDSRPRRRLDPTVDAPRTPLVASLARDVRELQLHLDACLPEAAADNDVTAVNAATNSDPSTLLEQLQHSIARDELPAAPAVLDPADHTVQVHACHGPARQVEVLREVLVGLLADDPSLEPRDVIVMCPNVEDYAALVSATFGLADETTGTGADQQHPGHRLRVRLADRSLRRTNPLLDVIATLVELAQARVTASELLDLAAQPPVRRRFGFDDDDLELLEDWAAKANVRWGLDAAHRAPYRLDRLPQNTWRAGLDRILLGAAMAEDGLRWLDTALPLDDVDSNDIDVAGRLAELVDRVTQVVDRMAAAQPLAGWVAAFTDALDLLTATSDTDAWQDAQARRELADLLDDAGTNAGTLPLSLGDVHALLADRLAGRATRANFRTGHLTVCSMLPMRSVPHRVVCLLGLDDGRFPRTTTPDGDDVLARDPLVGERDPRSEDRQLFLDALMAAQEHLVVLYTGADPRTNAAMPPAVPVGELLDTLDRLAVTADGEPAREQVVTRHPLQPFDPRNFEPGRLHTPGRPFSFDRVALHGAERASRPREEEQRLVPAALPAPPPDPQTGRRDVTLDELVQFFEHPSKGFLRQRLGVYVRDREDEVSEALCVELDRLQQWGVGDRLLDAMLRGASLDQAKEAEWRRGTLPPRNLGRKQVDAVADEVDRLAAVARRHVGGEQRTVDTVVHLDGCRVTGTVTGVRATTVTRVTFGRMQAKYQLRAWLQLLALAAGHPEHAWDAVVVARGDDDQDATVFALRPVDPDTARDHLADLVRLRAEGLCTPLPLPAKTAARYAAALLTDRRTEPQALGQARKVWEDGNGPENGNDAAHDLVWGTRAGFDALLDAPAAHRRDVGSRFAELALEVWEPLLAHVRRVPA